MIKVVLDAEEQVSVATATSKWFDENDCVIALIHDSEIRVLHKLSDTSFAFLSVSGGGELEYKSSTVGKAIQAALVEKEEVFVFSNFDELAKHVASEMLCW